MITEFQKERRKKYLGSSDAASIVGLNPWRSAADVYWDKIRESNENESTPDNDAIIVGSHCERAVLDWFEKTSGKKIIRNQHRVHENGIMAASFDALVTECDEAVEAKTAGIIFPFDRNQWGEVETDEVPDWVICQVQHQMAVVPNLKKVWVPVLLGGVGLRKYVVERNDGFIEMLTRKEVDFWTHHVERREPPTDTTPSMETMRRIVRESGKTVTLDDNLVEKWLEAKKKKSDAIDNEESIKKLVLSVMGDAEIGQCASGRVTFLEQERKETIIPASKFRVMRFSKNKGGKNGNAN